MTDDRDQSLRASMRDEKNTLPAGSLDPCQELGKHALSGFFMWDIPANRVVGEKGETKRAIPPTRLFVKDSED